MKNGFWLCEYFVPKIFFYKVDSTLLDSSILKYTAEFYFLTTDIYYVAL